MPITTPDGLIGQYNGDSEHFSHVYDMLFQPAIEDAGFEPVPPVTRGSDVIHANIIQKLETSDMALCDMTSLNVNVFFELGIRTALNKPVCLVSDDLPTKFPFDTSMINRHAYDSQLNAWSLPEEIKKLTTHIIDTQSKDQNKNALWKYFGLKQSGDPLTGQSSTDDKLDFIIQALESESAQSRMLEFRKDAYQEVIQYAYKFALQDNVQINTSHSLEGSDGLHLMQISGKYSKVSRHKITQRAAALGIPVSFSTV